MKIKSSVRNKIKNLLLETVRQKLYNYKPETEYMPFHYRLLGKDKYAMFSFIQSINTDFGTSIWEQIAVIFTESAGYEAKRQYTLLGEINEDTERLINQIYQKLRKGEQEPNKIKEIELIRSSIKTGEPKKDPDSIVDLFIVIKKEENYFDITSAKPNIKEFASLKLKLLRWIALRLSQDKNAHVFTRIAIPYNPYHPKPYQRWTLKNLYDLDHGELLVGEEFWNFVGGGDIYDDLLNVFEETGNILKNEIDKKFTEFK